MDFSPSSILLSLLTGLVAGAASYFAAYGKVKGELRAATEELKQTLQNLTQTTNAVELEKARIAADAALASDQRKAIYALAAATQALAHSMCWLSWDIMARGTMRAELAKSYDTEAHKVLPEIFGQLAVLQLLDKDLHRRAYPHVTRLVALDAQFGDAIVATEKSGKLAANTFKTLHQASVSLHWDIDKLFGGNLQLPGPGKNAKALVGKNAG
jgi:hypothetical protein